MAGTHTLLVEKLESSMLNPCLWLDKPVNLTDATVSSVSLVEPEGVILTVRVQDTNGLLAANAAADDLRIGTSHGRASFIPGLVTGRDATGRTMVVVTQPGQPDTILVSSATFALADDKGNALGPGLTQIPVQRGTVATAASVSATAPPRGDRAGDGEEVRGATTKVTGTCGGFYDVDNGNREYITRPFSGSRRRVLNRTSTLVSVLCALGVIPAWPQAQPTAQGVRSPSPYLDPASVPGPVRGYLFAFGNRLQVAGKERTVLTGTFSDASGSKQAQAIWQAPAWIRFDRTNQPSLVYDDVGGLQNVTSMSDADVLESLLDDSPQSFLYGFRRGKAYRLLGTRFRTDDGKTPNYQGPWYDIYAVIGPAIAKPEEPSREKLYYFDSVTGLLWKTVYELSGGVRVSTEYNKWTRSTSGDPFPGQIVRNENGATVFTFTVATASLAPQANDGVFPGH